MRNSRLIIPILIFLTGISLVFLSVFKGEANIALLIFIPVIYGGGVFLALGIMLLFFSFFLFFFIPFASYGPKERKENKFDRLEKKTTSGGVIFIGPIPIIFGGNESTAKKMMYLGLVIALILAVLYALYVFG